jgi:hypothetical protein
MFVDESFGSKRPVKKRKAKRWKRMLEMGEGNLVERLTADYGERLIRKTTF